MTHYSKIHKQIESQLCGGIVDKYGRRRRICLPEGQILTREEITQDIQAGGICKAIQLPTMKWVFTHPDPIFKWSHFLWYYYEKGIHRFLDKFDSRTLWDAIHKTIWALNVMREGYRFFAYWWGSSPNRVFRFDTSNNDKRKYGDANKDEWDGVVRLSVCKGVGHTAIAGKGKHGSSHTFKLSQEAARQRCLYNKHA